MPEIVSAPSPAEATPSASTPAAATPAAAAAPGAAATPQATPQPPATGGAPEGWVPSYRIRESREAAVREANAQFAQREADIRAEADQYKRQLHSLVGVQPPPNPEIAAVRSQFGQLYPGLAKLEERADQLLQLQERAGDLESQTEHYWQTYGRQTMDRLFTSAQTSLGAPLTDEAKRALHSSFVGFVQSSPELSNRYANDPTIVDDFWKAFTSSFIDPARRTASAQVVQRASGMTPQDTPGGIPHTAPAPPPKNLDERMASGWALYNQHKVPGSQ